ncbi:MAG: hypothetical protein AAB275_02065 [Deltaproteobacteria bacterium]
MFELCREKCYLDADRERVIRLAMSFNEPQVAPSGHHIQPTQAYICTLKERDGFSVYIYLYLTVEKTGVLYVYTNIAATADECRAAEEDATQFTEEMGFMIDDLKFSYLTTSQQDKLLTTIPLFGQTAKVEAGEKGLEEEVIETIEPVNEEEKDWKPEMFLSKFRMRAAAGRMKKDIT